jgi:hypothetical protein
MSNEFGFVYIWFDRWRKKFYIGCHWGTEDDGYVCSSRLMRQAYRRRPDDFKRRIISRVYTNRQDLLEKEFEWLSLIPDDQLGKRYYNMNKHHFGHWTATDDHRKVTTKISEAIKVKWSDPEFKARMTKIRQQQAAAPGASEKARKGALIAMSNPENRAKFVAAGSNALKGSIWVTNGSEQKKILKGNPIPDGWWRGRSQGFRNRMIETHAGVPQSEERKKAQSERMRGEGNHFYGRKHSEETKQRISIAKHK